MQERPSSTGLLFAVVLFLSFIPGPWQVITGPILSIMNFFFMAKFGLFFLGILAVFGLQWWSDFTTQEAACPSCGAVQRGPKSESFGCVFCGEELEAKEGQFVRYKKSGTVKDTFEQIRDFAKEAAAAAARREPEATPVSATSPASPLNPPRKSLGEVIDVEVL